MLTNNSIKVNDQLVHTILDEDDQPVNTSLGEVTVTGVPQRVDAFGDWGVYVQDAKGKIHYVKTANLERK